jgi:hypothetical protein
MPSIVCTCGNRVAIIETENIEFSKCNKCGMPVGITRSTTISRGRQIAQQDRPLRRDPLPQQSDHEEHKSSPFGSDLTIIFFISGAVATVALCFLAWFFLIRDTWEDDNHLNLLMLSQEVVGTDNGKNWQAAASKYEELSKLVGKRVVHSTELQSAITNAAGAAEHSRRRIAEPQTLLELQSLETEAKAFAATNDTKSGLEACKQALGLIRRLGTENREFALASVRVEGLIKVLEQQAAQRSVAKAAQETADRRRQEQETYDREMVAKGNVKVGSRWVTKDEYARLTARGKLRITATYFNNNLKVNVPGKAAVFAIPRETGLGGQKLPLSTTFGDESTFDVVRNFLNERGGGFELAGGDGKADLRLPPGKYRVIVIVLVSMEYQGDQHKAICELKSRTLSEWFSPQFSSSESQLHFLATKDVEVFADETTEASVAAQW